MLDRRLEVKRGLQHLADLDLNSTDSRYDVVKRFTHSYAILNRQLERKVSFWNRLSIDRLFKKLSQMEQVRAKPIPWLNVKTFKNTFWTNVKAIARESLLDIDDFEAPINPWFEEIEFHLEWFGNERPVRDFYTDGVIERFESPDDDVDYTPTGHFSHWWDLRLDLLKVLEWYGLVLPEDVDLDDQWDFYLTEDQLDDQKFVYVTVNKPLLLTDGLMSHTRPLLKGKWNDWAIQFHLGERESVCLFRDHCYTVGDRIHHCRSLSDVATTMQR